MIRNGDLTVHADWYCDGGDAGEQLWRMDFCDDTNSYQAQLFARVIPEQLDPESRVRYPSVRDEIEVDDEIYGSFRLYLERDNRNDESERIDFAFAGWPLTEDRALALLRMSEAEFAATISAEVAEVAAMPCDYDYCEIVPDDYAGNNLNSDCRTASGNVLKKRFK